MIQEVFLEAMPLAFLTVLFYSRSVFLLTDLAVVVVHSPNCPQQNRKTPLAVCGALSTEGSLNPKP